MAKTTTIYFVRHGEVYNPDDILYGRLEDFELSAEGHRQAQAVGDALKDKPLAAIFHSPLLRAEQTATAILAHHSSLSLVRSDELNEVHCPYDGTPVKTLIKNGELDVYTGTKPPYEQPIDVLRRVDTFVSNVYRRYRGMHVAAVTHGDLIGLLILASRGVEPSAKTEGLLPGLNPPHTYPAVGSISSFVFPSDVIGEGTLVSYTVPHSQSSHD